MLVGGGGGGVGRGYDDIGPPRGRDYGYDDRRGPPPRRGPPRDLRRSEHRVIVSGLPPSASWQAKYSQTKISILYKYL